jgi:ribosome-binding factor A
MKSNRGDRAGGRAERLGDAIRAELAELVREAVKDPRVHAAGLLTITRVELSGDLSHARVGVSFIGGEEAAADRAMKALAGIAGFLRGEVGRRLGLRHAPELKFIHDRSGEQSARIDALLRGDDE